ncbi:Arginine exporter protein argO [Vibrio nigripulchritudo SFn27]|uniref:Arginine exporter protein argO n=1 Tax=Vibrio nigripulchritudo TaxID=28173 RepID=U4K8A6_9VIBR|nr:LysE/ArgO family amino acid transporter [Vibrio nigripulchritudo]CCN83875.1 Arginine exporter protein argO [Vibrio nigripulchritudo BLFn1]CCN91102.1 Arginine exporter protein argO [Vibrio nigripulchritudo SFn27]CCN92695.1 Arginine exporter protein argO [Vibrio nigripulchritudo ENn2]CCO43893.1 Arginine exporter protein argO [Vibrio nigripulchritudo SFn135]CCO55559.1 Arginine exporter protein argO [Vibrio nigripulchritudo Wn13]
MNFWVLLQGFGLGATMIIPIGAQNAYVLNQGIKRNHHLTTATICSLLDVFFISLGIFGGGAILSQNEVLLTSVTLGGIAFLTVYGLMSLKSAFAPAEKKESTAQITARGKRAVVLGALAVTVLNPHLYLDTVVILGSIGGQYEGHDRIAFAIGTILASFAWFYSLSMGAAKLGPTLSKPKVKKGIDIGVAAMMFTIAFILAKSLWQQYMI